MNFIIAGSKVVHETFTIRLLLECVSFSNSSHEIGRFFVSTM
jgi:hypothetical protein